MHELSRRGLLLTGGGLAAAGTLSGCGLIGPKKPLKKGTPTPKGDALAKDWFVESQQSYGSLPMTGTPASTVFRTPHFGAQVKQYATTDKLDSGSSYGLGLEGNGPWRAADGYEFVFIELKSGVAPYADDGTTKFAIVADGVRHEVMAPFGAFDDSLGSYQKSSNFYGVSAPVGKPVTFEVTDAGKTAKLDCRTGQAVKDADTDACAAFNNGGAKAKFDTTSYTLSVDFTTDPPANYQSDSDSLRIYHDLKSAKTLAWTPDSGWAPAGQGFLQVIVDLTSYTTSGPDMTFNLKDVFKAKADGADLKLVKDAQVNLINDIVKPSKGYHAVLVYALAKPKVSQVSFTIDNKAPVVMQYKNMQNVPTHDTNRSAPMTTGISLG